MNDQKVPLIRLLFVFYLPYDDCFKQMDLGSFIRSCKNTTMACLWPVYSILRKLIKKSLSIASSAFGQLIIGRQQFTFYNFNYLFHDGGPIISFYMTGTSVMKESKIEKLFQLQLCRVMQVIIKQSLLHNYKDNQHLHNKYPS